MKTTKRILRTAALVALAGAMVMVTAGGVAWLTGSTLAGTVAGVVMTSNIVRGVDR